MMDIFERKFRNHLKTYPLPKVSINVLKVDAARKIRLNHKDVQKMITEMEKKNVVKRGRGYVYIQGKERN